MSNSAYGHVPVQAQLNRVNLTEAGPPKAPPLTESVAQDLIFNREELIALRQRIEQLADKLLGATPRQAEGQTGPSADVGGGFLFLAQNEVRFQRGIIASVHDELSRLNVL